MTKQLTDPAAPVAAPRFLADRAYVAVALTHFFIDILNSSRTLLVALLSIAMGLTNAQVGIALLFYNVGSALAQPLFGWLADRVGPRWLIVGGMGWMIGFYALAAVSTEWVALVAVTVAGVGSGAFHPTGTMVASQSSTHQRTQATAVFFMAGQLGLFMGPIVAGYVLDGFGRTGFILLPVAACLALASGLAYVRNPRPDAGAPVAPAARQRPAQGRWFVVVALAWVMLVLNTVSIGIMNFAPKLFAELGFSAAYAGATSGLWMLGSAAGGLLGGRLADRYGNRWPLYLGLLGAVAPIFFFIPAGDPWRFVLLVTAGFFGGMPHSIMVLMAQWLLPGRQALASGLSLGFMFMGGAVGSYVLGVVADVVGLAPALQWLALLPLAAAVVVGALPHRYRS